MKKLFVLALMAVALTACHNSDRTNFQQGNIIERQAIGRIRVGMTKDQVASNMGSPVYDNLFRKNRWIYIHSVREDGRTHTENWALNFNNGRLVSIKRG